MRIGQTMGVFASSCVVYTVMAACSTSVHISKDSVGSGGSGHGGGMMSTATGSGHAGGMMGAGGVGVTTGQGGPGGTMMSVGGSDSGIFDALTDPVPDAIAMPGNRLKGKYLLGDDGAREYQYVREGEPGDIHMVLGVHQLWYDSQLQVDCTFTTAADGSTRCLPIDLVIWDGSYADNQCTIAVVMTPSAPVQCPFTLPKYAAFDTFDLCQLSLGKHQISRRIRPVGPAVALPQYSALYQLVNGSCVATGGTGTNTAYLKLGAEVPVTAFVGSTQMIDP